MLTSLRVKGFKSWADTGELRLAPLTGLFGRNSSGKSSILQVLLMLKQTAESPDRRRVLNTGDEHSAVDLGPYTNLVHKYAPEKVLDIELSWVLPGKLRIESAEEEGRVIDETRRLRFRAVTEAPMAGKDSLSPKVKEFAYTLDSGSRFGIVMSDIAVDDDYRLVAECDGYQAKPASRRPRPLPAPVKCYGFPDEAMGYYQNTGFLPGLALAFEKTFARTFYLGPLRERPPRRYGLLGDAPTDVGARGEHAVHALIAASRQGAPGAGGEAAHLRTVEENVARRLSAMKLADSFSLRRITEHGHDYDVRVKISERGVDVNMADVGFGLSQVLPVLVLCHYVPEGSVILLEHPELHLHPSAQCELADLFIDVVTRRNVQIILESHSEHLLRRLQRRIAEERISREDAALYFCEQQDGASVAKALDIDEFGNIRNWPQDFFGDEMGDLVAMTEAAMRRQGVE